MAADLYVGMRETQFAMVSRDQVSDKSTVSPQCTKVSHQSRKQKGTPLRNREDIPIEPDIAVDDLHAPTDFGIMLGV